MITKAMFDNSAENENPETDFKLSIMQKTLLLI